MKQEIELIEKLNKISKKNLSPIRSLRILFRLYFKHLNIFKLNYILKPAMVSFALIFTLTSVTAYSYNSSSVVYGSALYGVKTGLENFISGTKTGLSKVKYYSVLLDKRVAEIEYLKSKNFNKIDQQFSLINVAYADDNTTKYNSAIANTILEISKINNKIQKEIVNITNIEQKKEATKIFETKKTIQKEVFNKIKEEKKILSGDKKINQDILKETLKVIDQIEPSITENNNTINSDKNIENNPDNKQENIDSNVENNSPEKQNIDKKQEDIKNENINKQEINKQEDVKKEDVKPEDVKSEDTKKTNKQDNGESNNQNDNSTTIKNTDKTQENAQNKKQETNTDNVQAQQQEIKNNQQSQDNNVQSLDNVNNDNNNNKDSHRNEDNNTEEGD